MGLPRIDCSQINQRNNVHVRGEGDQPMLLVHGFSCDQNMWRFRFDEPDDREPWADKILSGFIHIHPVYLFRMVWNCMASFDYL